MNFFEVIIVQPIFNLLLALYSVVPFADFGIAVIIFTIIVRFAMWPLVVKQLHQTRAMRRLQPELKRIKKASKGNRQLEGMQMLELYKKHGVKPFRSILMLLIQLPIFIALFQVIRIFTEHRDQISQYTYGFMQHFQQVRDLIANPENFNHMFLGVIDVTKNVFTSAPTSAIFLIILAFVAAYTQYIISKQTAPQTGPSKRIRDILAEAGEGKQPDQSEINAAMMGKMIKFLPIMMFFIMLSLPAALALYYSTSNIFAAVQQHFLLKKDVEELEQIANEPVKNGGKKATAKAREKAAREASVVKPKGENITRISAKDTPRKK